MLGIDVSNLCDFWHFRMPNDFGNLVEVFYDRCGGNLKTSLRVLGFFNFMMR